MADAPSLSPCEASRPCVRDASDGGPPSRLRIVLAGPESSGKSTLAAHLATVFGVPFAPEYAREYLEAHGPRYDCDLLLRMSRGHVASQRRHVPDAAALGILDTDLLNYKIWSESVFGHCPPEILAGIDAEGDHAYLLCYPDLPWVSDPLRENPSDRDRLFALHVREIERLGRAFAIIRGVGPSRFECAERAFRMLAPILA